jgi:hypothetical protein
MPAIFVNITLRVAAPGPRNIALELCDDGNELTDGTRLSIHGGDYHKFEDVRWEMGSLSLTILIDLMCISLPEIQIYAR